MTNAHNHIALSDDALEAVSGGGFLGDAAHIAKRGLQEVAHYSAFGLGMMGDFADNAGGELHKTLPKLVDGFTGRK